MPSAILTFFMYNYPQMYKIKAKTTYSFLKLSTGLSRAVLRE